MNGGGIGKGALVTHNLNSPTTIRQYVPLPSLQLMCAANLFECFLSRLEAEVVGVVET